MTRLPHGEGLPLPAYATEGAAGMDLLAAAALTIPPGGRALVPTGLDVALPADAEYVADVVWDPHDLLVTVSRRDQTAVTLLRVDPDAGSVETVRTDVDDAWVDLVPGVPAHLRDGVLVWCADVDDARRLIVGGEVVTPSELQVRGVADTDGEAIGIYRRLGFADAERQLTLEQRTGEWAEKER